MYRVIMIVDILDRVMLSHHRRMTVPLAKRALDEAGLIVSARERAAEWSSHGRARPPTTPTPAAGDAARAISTAS